MKPQDHDGIERYDDLIVGAGSSGAVIAARLSEDPERRVLLLEAGVEPTPSSMEEVRDAHQVAIAPGINWNFGAYAKDDAHKLGQLFSGEIGNAAPTRRNAAAMFDYQVGKVLGGSSSVNAVHAQRGRPGDYDEWAAECGGEWSWADVLPYFRKLEDDPLGPSELHGRGGPIPIRRERREDLRPLQAGLLEACLAQGHAWTDDQNDPDTTGVGFIPKNMVDGVRMSTAFTYLAAAQGRPNLTIVTGAHVHQVLWNSVTECDGVEAGVAGQVKRFTANRVILCAGALNTPAILMRSGIGNPKELQALDIEPRLPLHGVGKGLMDHPVITIWGVPKSDAATLGEPMRQVLLRHTSGHNGYVNDIDVCLMSGIHSSRYGMQQELDTPIIFGVSAFLEKSFSRGCMTLVSADPYEPPKVVVGLLSDPRDPPALREGVRVAWELMKRPELRERRERLLVWSDGMFKSDTVLDRAISMIVRPSAHPCSSARMGLSPDAGAVVSPKGRVWGTDNLYVADASIMPSVPAAPTNLTCIMIGEKIAASLGAQR